MGGRLTSMLVGRDDRIKALASIMAPSGWRAIPSSKAARSKILLAPQASPTLLLE
jgi:hypothetical protein